MSDQQVASVSGKVFAFAVATMLLVAFALSSASGLLTLTTMHELRAAQEVLRMSEENRKICKEALVKSEAKREQMDSLLGFAAGRRDTTKNVGGP